MMPPPSTSSRRVLALILALLAPGFAAAQNVTMSAAASGSAAAAMPAAASARAATTVAPLSMTSMPTGLPLTPTMTPSPLTAAIPVLAPSPIVVAAILSPILAAPVAAAPVARAALGALTESTRDAARTQATTISAEAPTSRLFDGTRSRRAIDTDAPVAAPAALGGPSALERPAAAVAPRFPKPIPAPATPMRGASRVVQALMAAALLLAFPAVALAAGVAAPALAGASSLAFLASIHPAVSAAAAAVGAVYGLLASRHKDGTPASTGEALTSMLRFGILAGAGVYVLLDLTQVLFLGASAAGLQPLSAAVATAALGQSAFQGTFKDPATSSADRIMSVFPAAAAALGLSVGIVLSLAVPTTLLTTALASAVAAMSVTGLAAALFSVLYTPGKSPENGPAHMARGFVLQALMTGMALALTNPYFVVPFLALGVCGFGEVLWATVSEVVSRLSGLFPRKG